MKNYEELIKNLVKSGINFKKDLKCQKKILQILTISEKLKSDTLTGY